MLMTDFSLELGYLLGRRKVIVPVVVGAISPVSCRIVISLIIRLVISTSKSVLSSS